MITTFNLYMGLPASGKTYLAYKEHGEDAVIIDSDDVRQRLLGNATDQSQNARVFEHMYKETCACLEKDVSCCYVATNLSMKRRVNLLKSLRAKFKYIVFNCYLVIAPLDICHERNSLRDRSVPTYVIDRMARSFDPPCENEGWDNIYLRYNYHNDDEAWLSDDGSSYRMLYSGMVEQFGSQDNEHHQLTLHEHCKKCGDLAYDALKHEQGTDETFTRDEVDIIFAAYFHDYGKALTKTYWNKDGGRNAHYPQHPEIGSYLVLTMGYNLHTAQLVRFHMVPYMDEAAQKTWRARLGEKLWREVMLLHTFDEAAH